MQGKLLLKSGLNYNLEALRGFAAFMVVIYHIIDLPQYFDRYYSNNNLLAFKPSGHLCVLVFFVLSGYVIGVSNKDSLTIDKILPYLKKRAIRIYPIYFLCISLAVVLGKDQLSTIFYNFTFTQVLLGPSIWANGPVWTLHYEVVYYLLFIPVSYFRLNPFIVLVVVIVLGTINAILYPHVNIPLISSYLFGFAFWVTGLCIARFLDQKELQINFSLLVSNLFLLLAINVYNANLYLYNFATLHIFKRFLDFPDKITWAQRALTFSDLSYLPYCFVSVLIFSSIKFRFKRHLIIVLQIIPLLSIPFLLKWTHHNTLCIVVSTVYYTLSWILLFSRSEKANSLCGDIIKWGVRVGSISYGLYIVHLPIMVIFGKIQVFSDSLVSYIVRVVIYIPTVLLIAYLLEKKFQPFIKKIT